MPFGILADFSLSRLLLGRRSFNDIETLVRAKMLSSLVFFFLPMPFVNFVRLRSLSVDFPFFAGLAMFLLPVLLIGLRSGFVIRWSGVLFGLCMQTVFIEGVVGFGSPSMAIGLALMPFFAVMSSGRKLASLLLVAPLSFAFGLYRFIPLLPKPRFEDLAPAGPGFTPETMNLVVLVVIVYFAASTIEKIALNLNAANREEKKATEKESAARKEKERILQTVFSAFPLPVFVKDAANRYTACSDSFCDYIRKPRDAVIGNLASEVLVHPANLMIGESDRQLLEMGSSQTASVQFRYPDGEVRDATVLKTQVKDESGKFSGSVGVVIDETDRLNRERRLESLLDSNRGALALLGHDLRNPIGSFRDLVHAMERDSEIDPAEFREVLSEMGKSLDSLYRLLEELLEWAKAEGSAQNFRPERLSVRPVVDKVFSVAALQADAKGISLETRIPQDLPAYADERMLETILRNLIANALKFTPKGGIVAVAASRSPAEAGITVSVSDTGIGMSVSALRSLFETGTAKHRLGTDGEPGTGLGLALCKRLVERHGGTIEIESIEGAGSVFSVFLPETKASAPAAALS